MQVDELRTRRTVSKVVQLWDERDHAVQRARWFREAGEIQQAQSQVLAARALNHQAMKTIKTLTVKKTSREQDTQEITKQAFQAVFYIRMILSHKNAHFTEFGGFEVPKHNPEDFGWVINSEPYAPGVHIGWVDEEFAYLKAKHTFEVIQDFARKEYSKLAFGERSLASALKHAGISEPGHGGRPTRNEHVGGSNKSWVIKVHLSHIKQSHTFERLARELEVVS